MKLFDRCVRAFDVGYRVYMRLYGKFQPVRTAETFFGSRLRCDVRDFVQRRIAFFGIYEPNLTHFILHTVRPGDVFVDVGANIGYFSLLASTVVGPSGKVISIEAAPDIFGLLCRNLEQNDCRNVQAMNVAVMDRDCFARVVSGDRRNLGMTKIEPVLESAEGFVEGRSLLTLLRPDLARVSFIKIDIEGSEAPVLSEIFANADEFLHDLVVVAEVGDQSSWLIDTARDAGFTTYSLRNDYTIGYFLVRAFLNRRGEGDFFTIRPVDGYVSNTVDYVFHRPAARAASHQDAAAGRLVQPFSSVTVM